MIEINDVPMVNSPVASNNWVFEKTFQILNLNLYLLYKMFISHYRYVHKWQYTFDY